ncbi:hypothetical protein OT109_14395 [Phycisphaeraceae bacterium D3-23]
MRSAMGDVESGGTRLPLFLLVLSCVLLTGCAGPYVLQGKVVEGPVAEVIVLDADDPRFAREDYTGAGASVSAIYEPGRGIGSEKLGRFVADQDGMFSVPIDHVGMGMLDYEVELVARRQGHQSAIATIRIPGRGKRVLITLPVGVDTLRRPEDIVDETLRDARPYLEGRR